MPPVWFGNDSCPQPSASNGFHRPLPNVTIALRCRCPAADNGPEAPPFPPPSHKIPRGCGPLVRMLPGKLPNGSHASHGGKAFQSEFKTLGGRGRGQGGSYPEQPACPPTPRLPDRRLLASEGSLEGGEGDLPSWSSQPCFFSGWSPVDFKKGNRFGTLITKWIIERTAE